METLKRVSEQHLFLCWLPLFGKCTGEDKTGEGFTSCYHAIPFPLYVVLGKWVGGGGGGEGGIIQK